MDVGGIRRYGTRYGPHFIFKAHTSPIYFKCKFYEDNGLRATCWYECERLIFFVTFYNMRISLPNWDMQNKQLLQWSCSNPGTSREGILTEILMKRNLHRPNRWEFVVSTKLYLSWIEIIVQNTVVVCKYKIISFPKPDWKSCIWTRWELTILLIMMNYTFRWHS